jgi:aspartate racemase
MNPAQYLCHLFSIGAATERRVDVKSAGMIGGIGPESTAVYYRRILAGYRKAKNDGSFPSLVINSIDMQKMLGLIVADRLIDLTAYLLTEIEKLAAAGASFGFLASNAPHIVYDDLQGRSPIPLISIVKTVCALAKTKGFKRLGLFGARFTMQGKFYTDVFTPAGIELVTPDRQSQNYIHEKYMGELVNGIGVPETREELLRIMEHLKECEKIEGVILAGTELSLLFQEDVARGIPLLDTTRIHVQAIVERLLE